MNGSVNHPDGPRARRAVILVVAGLLAGCGGAGAAPQILGTVGSSVGGGDRAAATAAPAPEFGSADGQSNGNAVLDAARPELLIIKTGNLELQVEAVDTAVEAAAARITALGGYVSGSEQVGEGEDVSATITCRIPAEAWDQALEQLRGLALKVVSERTGTEDVTGQVVDLRARITNLQATEKALQAIMTQATKISDVLAVQSELTTVRGQIEEATAQRQHLEQQAAYSTLTVRFSLQPEPAVVASQKKFDPGNEVDQASARLVEVLQGLATAGIWFGIVWLPILIVVGILALIVVFVVRRRVGAEEPGAPGAGPLPPLPPLPPAEPAAPATGG